MTTEMVISCQQNVHWPATNHLSGHDLVQATTRQPIGHGEGVTEVAMHKLGT